MFTGLQFMPKKPFIANVADNIPQHVLTALIKTIQTARCLDKISYMESLDNAFGKELSTVKYLFPGAYHKCKDDKN